MWGDTWNWMSLSISMDGQQILCQRAHCSSAEYNPRRHFQFFFSSHLTSVVSLQSTFLVLPLLTLLLRHCTNTVLLSLISSPFSGQKNHTRRTAPDLITLKIFFSEGSDHIKFMVTFLITFLSHIFWNSKAHILYTYESVWRACFFFYYYK